VPWQDLRLSTNFQSLPGPGLQAAVLYASLTGLDGSNHAITGGGNKTVNLFDPNTSFGDRLNQLDLRFSKIFKWREGSTFDANFDIYNALNSDAVTAETTAYTPTAANGGAWRKPTGVIQGRIFKFGMRWDF
jgi:hypothetical protein